MITATLPGIRFSFWQRLGILFSYKCTLIVHCNAIELITDKAGAKGDDVK